MNSFRKLLFWSHLISGVLAGIFIFLMCVTGAMLSFQSNILQLVERDMRFVKPEPRVDGETWSVSRLLTQAQSEKPDSKPSGVTFYNNPNAAVVIAFGREGQMFVNPYNGQITGEGAKNWRVVFRTTEDVHRWLALPGAGRPVGKALNDAANVLFLFLAISGVYIWFPQHLRRSHFAPVLWFRKTGSGRARDFNWHNVIGFWTSSVLIILTLTGIIISYQWAGNLLYTITGNEVPAPQQPGPPPSNEPSARTPLLTENADGLIAKAMTRGTWKSISLRLPIAKETAIFAIDEGIYWNRFGRSTLTVDSKSGEVSKWEPYGELNAGRQLRTWSRFTHTGETGGFAGQLIGFIACIGGAVLVYTGISLALRRLANWRGKRSSAEV